MPEQPENWGSYPAPHYDEDDDCQCPDHAAMRLAAQQLRLEGGGWTRAFIEGMASHE